MPEKKKTICVMIGDISYDYTNELMNGMNEAARQEGVQLFYMTGKQKHTVSLDSDKELEAVQYYNSIYDYVELVGADAYIISCGSLSGFTDDQQYLDFLKRFEGTNHVVLHEQMEEIPGRTMILINNYDSVCELAEHLILDHGHKKIAFVSGPKNHPDGSVRERAYVDTMKKHGLAVEKGMLYNGDLSGFVAKEVNQLLDDYPDLDAIMFCNDEMVRTAYRILSDRGLKAGKDIAITGFDNFTTGRTLTPPLTTISQNAIQSGFMAVMAAINLIQGKPSPSLRMETSLHIRNSCGCTLRGDSDIFKADAQSDTEYIELVTGRMRDDLLKLFAQDNQKTESDIISDLMAYAASASLSALGNQLDENAIDDWIKSTVDHNENVFAQIANRIHHHLMKSGEQQLQPAGRKLFQVLLYMQGFLHTFEVRKAVKRYDSIRSQAWFAPEFIRDLVVMGDEDEGIFLSAVDRLRIIGLEKVYICLLPEPQRVNRHGSSSSSETLLLAAYLNGDESMAYPRSRMPTFDKHHPLSSLPSIQGDEHLITFSIFSGDIQYGVLLCKTKKESIPILHIIGLQLGILVNFLDLKEKERVVLSELENTRERIEILSFLSEYHPMCNVYNRRGFIERAIRLNRENEGKRAFCAFLDLNNLKEINDYFGHSAGDEAIITTSNILKSAVRSNDLVARIGGDEFIVILLVDNPEFVSTFKSRIQNLLDQHNHASDKPYNIEAAIGIAEFTCRPGFEIRKVIDQADQKLYEEKKSKRLNFMK